jgi:hypothetical protein
VTDANRLNPAERIERLESLMIQLGTISQAHSQMVDDHEDRIQRLEQLNVALGENLLQMSRLHEDRTTRLEDNLLQIAAQHNERISRLEVLIESLSASNDRLDHIIDYLLRRDENRPE